MKEKLVGVLGGVGPMATVYFMEMLLSLTQATRDQDHIDLLVSNHSTIPDRTDFILNRSEESPLEPLIGDAKMLERAGCDFIVLPCNTAHYFYQQIQQNLHIPFLNIIEETVSHCVATRPGMKRLGVLATEGTVFTKTYQLCCEKFGLECVVPGEGLQKEVSFLIYDRVKAGKAVSPFQFLSVLDKMRRKGCDAIVLGCTELSVAFQDLQLSLTNRDVVDSLTVLACQTIRQAGKRLKESGDRSKSI